MKRASFLYLIFLLLTSCTPTPTSPSVSTTIAATTELQPAFTVIPATATFTALPATRSSTPEPCNPLDVEYCITDGHFIFQRPIRSPANIYMDSTYPYASTANGTRDPHHGVEFLNKFGTPVHAAGDGVVIFAGPDDKAIYSPWPNFYGNMILLQHANDLYTLYAHLSKINVATGQHVIVGEQIGEVGQSGVATGSHLHFEVRRGNPPDYFATQNPALWLAPNLNEDGAALGVIQIAIRDQTGQLVPFAEVTLQKYDEQNRPVGNTFFSITYEKSMLWGEENLAMGDLPPGKYRIALQYNGQLRERWVEVKSGKLTHVVFTVK